MTLDKLIITLGLTITLATILPQKANGQTDILNSTKTEILSEFENTEHLGIPVPTGTPNFTTDLYVNMNKPIISMLKLNAGHVEVRDNSLYAVLARGNYQILFEQIDDTTFVERLYNYNSENKTVRYEIFTTKKRKNSKGKDYFVLEEYVAIEGEKRAEKIPLENKTYSDVMPAVVLLNKLLKNELPEKPKILVFGIEYPIEISETRKTTKNNETKVKKYADLLNAVERTPDDVFIMENPINLYLVEKTIKKNGKDTTLVTPIKLETMFEIINYTKKKILNNKTYDVLGDIIQHK
jgi:hypothetical protein